MMMRSNLFRFLDTLDTYWFPCLGFLGRLAARARFAISTALWEFWLLFLLLLLGIPALAAVWPLGSLWVLFRLFGLLLPGFDIDVNGARIPLSGAIRRMIRFLLVVMSISRGELSVRLIWVKKDLLVSPRLRQLHSHTCIGGNRVWWRCQFEGGMKPLPVVPCSHWGGCSPWMSLIGLNQVQLVLMYRRGGWQVFLILCRNSSIVEMRTLFKTHSQALPESKPIPCRFLVRA